VIVQPIAHSSLDRRADAQDGPLAVRAQPQVPIIHQELGAVFLRGNGKFGRFLDDLNGADVQLVTAGGTGSTRVGPQHTAQDERGFQRQTFG
jgi:hypothetical protein